MCEMLMLLMLQTLGLIPRHAVHCLWLLGLTHVCYSRCVWRQPVSVRGQPLLRPLPRHPKRRCRNIVLKDKQHASLGWCQDFLETGRNGRSGSCCKADRAIFYGWCMQVSDGLWVDGAWLPWSSTGGMACCAAHLPRCCTQWSSASQWMPDCQPLCPAAGRQPQGPFVGGGL